MIPVKLCFLCSSDSCCFNTSGINGCLCDQQNVLESQRYRSGNFQPGNHDSCTGNFASAVPGTGSSGNQRRISGTDASIYYICNANDGYDIRWLFQSSAKRD